MKSGALLVLAVVVSPCWAAQRVPFPGGVELETKVDEMTDKKTCAVFTPLSGVYVAVSADNEVGIWTPEKVTISKTPEPLLRIGDAPPFTLVVSTRPHLMTVPSERTSDVLKALYSRAPMRLRYWDWPSQDPRNVEIDSGDFGAAYQRARTLCGWRAIEAPYTPLAKEPRIFNADEGYRTATFGGGVFSGWKVTIMPKYSSCTLGAGAATKVFSSRAGKPEAVLPLGKLEVRDAEGKTIAEIEHKLFAPAPTAELVKAARIAGEYGSVRSAGLSNENVSLYGFAEAVAYVEEACNVQLAAAPDYAAVVADAGRLPSERIAAAKALGKSEGDTAAAVDGLIELLRKGTPARNEVDFKLALEAIEALGSLGPAAEKAIPALTAVTQSPAPEPYWQPAAAALQKIKPQQ